MWDKYYNKDFQTWHNPVQVRVRQKKGVEEKQESMRQEKREETKSESDSEQ